MLDEWMEQKVDEACEVVPAYVNPRKIRLASSHIGWRLYLYGSGLKRAVSGFFVHIRSEQDMDIFLRETAEKSDTTILRACGFASRRRCISLGLRRWERWPSAAGKWRSARWRPA